MNLTVNGIAHEIESAPADDPARRAPRGARRHEPQGGVRAGRVRLVHRARRRRAAARVPDGVASVEGAEVTTVEGIGTAASLAAVQQAFTHHYAAQCGFCTSGMLLAAEAYVQRGGTDDREAIQEALAGHVCRCTGYVKIIDAVAALARGDEFDITVTAPSAGMTNLGGVQ